MKNSLQQGTRSTASNAKRLVQRLLLLAMLSLPFGGVFAGPLDPPTPPPPPPDPSLCTPNGWSAPTTCQPIQIGQWKFYDMSGLPYGRQLSGYYNSMAGYFAGVSSAFSGFCHQSTSNLHQMGNTQFSSGVEYRKYWKYTITLGSGSSCTIAVAGYPEIQQVRDISCIDTAKFSLVQVGIVYMCACKVAECIPPRCAKGNLAFGNPCDVLTGRKFQSELDYRATGDFPLEFRRSYDSGRMSYGGKDPVISPMGNGWMGSYLQSIRYSDSTGAYVHRPNGNIVIFYESADVFAPADEVGDTLEWVYQAGVKSGLLYTTSGDVKELYDLDGRLQSVTSRSGIVHTLTYDSLGYVASVSDSFGTSMQFIWSSATPARLMQVTLPGGEALVFGYGTNNNLVSVTYPDSRQRVYHYELTDSARVNLLTGITAEDGVRFATWDYDSSGRAIRSEHAGGVERYTFAFNSNGSRVVTDPLGTAHTYTTSLITSQRRYTSADSACGGCPQFTNVTYDARGNFDTLTDFGGAQIKYVFDPVRNLEIYQAQAFGTPKVQAKATTWHSTFKLPTLVVESKRSTAYSYDTNGNVQTRAVTDTSATPNVSREWTYTYNAYGQVLTEDGPRTDVSDVTTFTYYDCTTGFGCGRLHTVTDALGHTTTFLSYNAHGQPLAATDANGVTTTMSYDARQRVTSRSVGSETTTYSYWPTGLLRRTTLPDGSYVENAYDDAQRLLQITDGEGNSVTYSLDAMGNRTGESVYDPTLVLARTRTQVFNSLNQLYKQIGAAGTPAVTTTFLYDVNGRQSGQSAPLGRNQLTEYDELGRMDRYVDPAMGETAFGYDSAGNLASVVDPKGLTTSYSYNGFDEITEQASPDTGTTASSYDAAGNLATKTDARGLTGVYAYDALNRLTAITYPTESVSFAYDSGANSVGRLSSASDANHSMAWSYDAQGRVVSKTQIVAGVTRSVGYSYVDGNLSTVTTPSGQTVSYGYTAGRITSVSVNGGTVLTDVIYEPFGPARQWSWGNSSISVRTYDLDGKITQLDSGGEFYEYSYDDAFRISGISSTSDPSLSWAYTYDSMDRLGSATSTPKSQVWTYDGNGNRLTESGSVAGQPLSNTLTISSASNRVSSIAGSHTNSYGYDAMGSVTSETNAGRRVGVSAASTVSYLYNALSQRIWKSGPSTPTIFIYDESGHMLGEYSTGGSLVQETVWLGDIPIATLRPRPGGGVDVYYVHTDHLNTPRKVSRAYDDVVVWTWDPSPFGDSVPNENPQDAGTFRFNLRFPGQYYDGESGLHYNYMRDYDPYTGRYVESDPIGLKGGINTYAYVLNNPLSYVDSFGLYCTKDFVAHYYGRSGTVVDLSSVGLLDDFRSTSSVRNAVDDFKRILLRGGAARARKACAGKSSGTSTEAFHVTNNTGTNVTFDSCLFAVGRSTFFRSAGCFLTADCCSRQFSVSCTMEFGITDVFEHPLNFPFETGGRPYPITGSWNDSVFQAGSF